MNIVGNFAEKPNAYHIGKSHENWALGLINLHPQSDIVHTWLGNIYEEFQQPSSSAPETHTEKSDFFISLKVRQKNGMNKIFVEGVSAKCGTTSMPGQLFRGSLSNVSKMNFIPQSGSLHNQHKEWLTDKKNMVDIEKIDTDSWKQWYAQNWDDILQSSLFGIKTKASSILMSNLDYDESDNNLKVTETVLVHKTQVLEDLKILSNAEQVSIDLSNRGKIVSGIISIQRAGGSNGEKGSEDWQARINRSAYIKWVKENRPHTVWTI